MYLYGIALCPPYVIQLTSKPKVVDHSFGILPPYSYLRGEPCSDPPLFPCWKKMDLPNYLLPRLPKRGLHSHQLH